MTTSLRRPGAYAPLRTRAFALVWTSGLISLAGDWALRVALPVLMLQLTGSVVMTSGIVIATVLPSLVIGPFAGVLVDRWCRRRVMVVGNLLQALALLPLLAIHDARTAWIAYAVAFAESTLASFVAPAENALLPSLVGEEQLIAANALNSLNNNIARLAGPAIGGVVAAWGGLAGVAWIDVASFVMAAGLLGFVGGRYAAERIVEAAHPVVAFARELVGGLRTIARTRTVLVIVVAFTGTAIGEGVMGSLMPVLVTRTLHGGTTDYGALMSAQAVGGVVGGLVGGWIGLRFSLVRLVAVGGVLMGLVDVVLFNYGRWWPVLWPGLACFVLAGVPAVLMGSSALSLLQTALEDGVRGRVFAAFETSTGAGQLVGAGLAGVLGERIDVSTLLTVQGVGLMAAGVFVGYCLRSRASASGSSSSGPSRIGMRTPRDSATSAASE